MTELQMIKTILNGPVHHVQDKNSDFWKDSDFWFTVYPNDNYVYHDWSNGEWTVHCNGYLGTGKTLKEAYESAFCNATEDWNLD